MKNCSALLAALLILMLAPTPQAEAQVGVSIDFFYDALQPYGDWICVDGYGYCWQPFEIRQNDWHPYTDGYWAWTNAGWTWISYERFGWATYHYGRWMRINRGWCWVPGVEWAPAWVSWRQSDQHIGWAPLPPEACWSVNVGFHSWTDSYYGIGPSYYNFVSFNHFARRESFCPVVIQRHQNIQIIQQSVNITHITSNTNVVNNIFVGGPDINQIDRLGSGRIERLNLRRDDTQFRREWLTNDGTGQRGLSSISRIERDQLIVASPRVQQEVTPNLPRTVRERVSRPDLDHGWRGTGTQSTIARVRDDMQRRESSQIPSRAPERRPSIATSTTPPPAVGRNLRNEERLTSPASRAPSFAGQGTPSVTPRGPTDSRTAVPPTISRQPTQVLPPRNSSQPSRSGIFGDTSSSRAAASSSPIVRPGTSSSIGRPVSPPTALRPSSAPQVRQPSAPSRPSYPQIISPSRSSAPQVRQPSATSRLSPSQMSPPSRSSAPQVRQPTAPSRLSPSQMGPPSRSSAPQVRQPSAPSRPSSSQMSPPSRSSAVPSSRNSSARPSSGSATEDPRKRSSR